MQRIGLIGGTGFGEALIDGAQQQVETQYGSAAITRGILGEDQELIFVARHGAGHKVAPHLINHRANIAALAALRVDGVLATAAVGALRTDLEPGDFVVLDDLIDMTKGAVVTFFDQPGEVRHTDISQPYDQALRSVLLKTAGNHDEATVHAAGTYVCVSGPRYETPAEIRLFANWGASVVGMTSAPEAILCREAALRYASVAIVTNYGCGLVEEGPLSHSDVEAQMTQRRAQLAAWLLRAARAMPSLTKI